MSEYVWKPGRRGWGDPQVIGERIEQIRSSNPLGVCTVHDYVNDAEDPKSPLHKTLEWNDVVAAENWRGYQARQVLHTLRLVIDGETQKEAAFMSVEIITDTGVTNGYVAPRDLTNPELQQQLLEAALRYFRQGRERYNAVKALQPVWDALETVH